MTKSKSKLRLTVVICMISVSAALGGMTSCTGYEANHSDSSQTIAQKATIDRGPIATPTDSPIGPPPAPARKPANYQEMHGAFTLRLRKKVEEREREIALQPIENLPDSASEIRLWYFPAHDSDEKLRGIIFSTDDDRKRLVLVNETSKEEVYLDEAKLENLAKVIEQSHIETLKDTKTIEFIPSPGDRYLVYQIRSGQKVSFKIYPATVGMNVKQTGPNDICDAAELCRMISELLSLNLTDCKCSLE
jgi:hypothetical protein